MSAFRLLTGTGATVLKLVRNVSAVGVPSRRSFKRWLAPTLNELYRRKKKLEFEVVNPPPPDSRSTFLEWSYKAEWYAFGKRLHEEFDEKLLQQAFTHRSHIIKEEQLQREAGIENPEIKLEDNRELVEKGDSFMRDYIRKYVCLLLPRFPEEGISAVCNYLMEEELLAHISSHIGTKDLILSADVPPEQVTLALTLKAVIGALLESSGRERAGLFVRDFVVTQLVGKDVNEMWHPEDPVATLESIVAQEGRGKPEPRLINEAARNTILAVYEVAMYSDKEFLGSGYGETIPTATKMAAYDALTKFFQTTESMAPFCFELNPATESSTATPCNVSMSEWKLKNVIHC